MDLRDQVEVELGIIRETFNQAKMIPSVLILLKNEERFVLPFAFKNEEHKNVVAAGMRDLVKNTDPDVVIYVSEAWITKFSLDAIRMGKLLKESKEREEMLTVQVEYKTGEKFGHCAKILRQGSKVRLGEFKSYQPMGGRFMDFYPTTAKN